MAVTWNFYYSFKQRLGNKEIDLDSDTIKIVLLDSSYVPDQSAHEDYTDLSGELTTANGYTQAAKALTSVVWSASGGTLTFDADDITWTASGGDIGPARYAAIYDDTHASDALIGYLDFAADKTAGDGTPFLISWNASGIFTLT